jgi:histidinol-phosphate aminotransferase
MTIVPKPGVLDISVYVPGRSEATGAARTFKLSSNESPFGPSPKAIAAYESAEPALGVYPEGTSRVLREAIAAHFKLPADCIVCGNGSDEILHLIANCYVRPGDEVIFSEHAFSLYKIATHENSATPVEVPERNLHFDVDGVLKRANDRTRIVFIANPNNPTGTYLSATEMRRLHAGLPKTALLVIDAAYAEYVRKDDYDSGIELVNASDNVIMTRTFSKAYGLAGIRIGWGYCPKEIADVLNRVRAPFNVNIAAQKAALAALADQAFVEHVVAHNSTWRTWLTAEIRKLSNRGIRVDDSVGNFLLVHFADAKRAQEADKFLMSRGVILRGCASYALPQCLRLTIGSEDANRAVAAALKEFAAS